MNKTEQKRQALLALFIRKVPELSAKPDIEEIDLWRRGLIKGKRAQQIKQHLASDETLYRLWQQLRQEAKEEKEQEEVTPSVIVQITHWLTTPKALLPVAGSAFAVLMLMLLIPAGKQDILLMAKQDIQQWQQITQQNKGYDLGMSRGWKPQHTISQNMQNYRQGLNTYLKTPLKIEGKSNCAKQDKQCQHNKLFYQLFGQWVSKANVICQKAGLPQKQQINQRLMLWAKQAEIKQEWVLNRHFQQWQQNQWQKFDPCQKIQALLSEGVNT